MAAGPDYEERVYGGVLGKLIGVYLGRPFENWSHQRIMAELGPIRGYVHDRLDVPLVVTDDDIAGTFTFVRALEDSGYDPNLDSARIGEAWLNYVVEGRTILWWGGFGNSTEETAWRRLRAGMSAPLSGAAATNGATVAEQIGAQIFIDGWALVSPGRPAQAARLAREAARVSHDGEAVHAAVLIAAMEAASFEEAGLERVLETGLREVPAGCVISRLADDVRRWHAADPQDWFRTRALLEERYGYDRYPGHCHVIPNHGVVLMALVHGGDDFSRSLEIACTAGWDTDCNAGNVGCLNGIRLGLAGIDASAVDWRGPVADRLLLSTADGGEAVTDAARVSLRLARAGRILSGEAPTAAPKDGARLHFALPGSVQGFAPDAADGDVRVEHTRRPDGTGCLAITRDEPGRDAWRGAFTPTFMPADVGRMRTYDLQACPALHPGQTVAARLRAADTNGESVTVALALLVHGRDDRPEQMRGPEAVLAPGESAELGWRVPDLGGRPIISAGAVIASARQAGTATLFLDRYDWQGVPEVTLRRPDEPGSMWRRAWVNAVSLLATGGPEAFRISQNEGQGLLIYGAREWQDLCVLAPVAVRLGEGGLAVRVQGLRRYYALMLRAGRCVLIKVSGGHERVLAESPCAWRIDGELVLELTVRGDTLRGGVTGATLLEAVDRDDPLRDGAVALVVATGAMSAERVTIRPARALLPVRSNRDVL